MAEPLVAFDSFSYRYPDQADPALADLGLEVAEGELIVLAGRSGAGKSTLLRACCGLVPHYHGGVASGGLEVCGLDVREHGPAELGGLVGLVGQDPESQIVSATVRGELELPLELRGESSAARARALEEVTLALAIDHLVERPTDTLSGGELQRVALAAALVLRPRLVLLDEPTSQLDPVAGDELIGLLRRLNEEWGMGIVLAEHRLERCLAAADRVLCMDSGRIEFDGSPHGFCDWAITADPVLVPPAATLFSRAGLGPLPVSAKEARRSLRDRGIGQAPAERRPAALAELEPPSRAAWRRLRRAGPDGPGRRTRGVAALRARALSIERDRGDAVSEVLRGVNLSIEPGERVALMGRNGAGKSTLLRACAGLIDPARGELEAPAGCALLPQSADDLFLHERVENELPGRQGFEALAAVELEWAISRDPRDLSGGERERLALAIVMAGRGDGPAGVVCLDEPTRGMDAARKQQLADELEVRARGGSAVLIATHDVEFASRFAERVILLGAGELIADGPADEILSGGWYFATEVARVLGGEGAITPEAGARRLRSAIAAEGGEVIAR